MTTITGFTASRMLEIEAASVVDGTVVGDNLILVRQDASTIDAGSVRGPQGDDGPPGPPIPIGCRILNSVAVTIPDSTPTEITVIDIEHFDIGDLHSTITNSGRITIVEGGIYIVTAFLQWDPSAPGIRYVEIHLYDSDDSLLESYRKTWAGDVAEQDGFSIISKPNATQYFVLFAYQDTGGDLDIIADGVQFTTARIG